jgi:death-on-curing protein
MALHAPTASFEGKEFYPDFIEKAALLVVRLIKDHPLADGNKRAAWVSLRMFIEMNDWTWTAYPDVVEAERVVLLIAVNDWDRPDVSEWLRGRLAPPDLDAYIKARRESR